MLDDQTDERKEGGGKIILLKGGRGKVAERPGWPE
jgi:hypothetical protein